MYINLSQTGGTTCNNEAMVCLVSNTRYKDLVSKDKGRAGGRPEAARGKGVHSNDGSDSTESVLSLSHLQSLTESLATVPGVKCVLYNYNPSPMDADTS